MKKLFTIVLCAFALAVTACDKDENGVDEIVAALENNQVSYNGQIKNVDGYINKLKNDNGEEAWIVDLFCGDDNGSVSGILQGTFFGKDVDLVKVGVSELLFSFEVSARNASGDYSSNGFMLRKENGKIESSLGENIWNKEPVSGSCFKSGKITSKVSGKNAVITVSGTLNDGTTFAVKLNRPFEDRSAE